MSVFRLNFTEDSKGTERKLYSVAFERFVIIPEIFELPSSKLERVTIDAMRQFAKNCKLSESDVVPAQLPRPIRSATYWHEASGISEDKMKFLKRILHNGNYFLLTVSPQYGENIYHFINDVNRFADSKAIYIHSNS